MKNMFFLVPTKDQDVVKIDDHKLPKKRTKIWVMTLMNVLGVFDNLKGMTNHSYNMSLILQAVFHSSPSRIRI